MDGAAATAGVEELQAEGRISEGGMSDLSRPEAYLVESFV